MIDLTRQRNARLLTSPVSKSVAFVFVLSATLRIIWVAFAEVTPISDFAGYDHMATRLLSEGKFGNPAWRAYRTPGYPGFLAIVYAIFGHSWQAAGFVQAVMGGLTSAMIACLAGRVAGVRASVVAGLLHAFWPTALAYVPVLASENLAAPLLVLGILLLSSADHRAGWRRHAIIAGGGCVCGLLLLVRPAALFFLPAWGIAAMYGGRNKASKAYSVVAFALALGITLAPWLIRNYRYGLGPLTLSSVGPLNLYMGNHDLSRAGGFNGQVERAGFARLGEGERAAAYTAATFKWIVGHPRHYLALCGVRFARHMGTTADSWAARYLRPRKDVNRALAADREHRRGRSVAPDWMRELSRRVRAENTRFLERWRVGVAPLMLLALAFSFAHWRRFAVVLLPAVCYILGLVLTFGDVRFRQLSDSLLIVLLASLISDILFKTTHLGAKPTRWMKLAIAVLLIILSAVGQKTRFWERFYILPPPPPVFLDGYKLPLEPVRFVGSPERYRSEFWNIAVRESRITLDGAALRCEIQAGQSGGQSQYAGIKFPAANMKALQLDLSWINPAAIRAVFVDGYDGAGRRQPLWSWKFDEETLPRQTRGVYTLVVGHPSGYFLPRRETVSVEVQEVHVFVLVTPGSSTGFILHAARVASD